MGNLSGKVAFVTGGGSGIGRGICERLAREGADVCIPDIDTEGAEMTANLVTQLGCKAHVVRANTASVVHIQKAAQECVDHLGGLDIAVANAGIGRGGSVLEMSLKDWQDQVDVNLTGVFLTVQACAQQMVKLGASGRIVCLASLAAENTGAGMWSYSATKAGVRMMVRGWAQELGLHGITVNAIGPGIIETPLAQGLAGEEGGALRRDVEARTPVGRVGKPSDIAGLVNYMAGPDGGFMTGSYVLIDGGLRDARGGQSDEDAQSVEAERAQLWIRSAERTARMQPLLDERE
ncbi:MAG: SDR family oxidoreductase [Pseudomonadales bacterium]|jgi:NAD(P)-dependent dehydrogenase (short-subunit alcohol dehydrogenase family)|nr:SDR family oxidoreductase [Pseudomonadales bacterium]MDP6470507.1 SDR family oxidoreductase [Pseudomonadales bacterium]MDP6827809.1 SDR family oxidoreductase [Pseudomonadales bacterium]MDP6972981.1 SDR family oxidoreductase [Pseudomonadales bacterium]|tara:strand:+ start:938 stop:1813 length:876 start_codon:yes stop_codon:yes gene_type:complete